jgi:outer membrane protein assembly factor BamE
MALAWALAACSGLDGASRSVSGIVGAYKMDVVQGNFVSSEQLDKLKAGMGRQAVRDLLGTPLLRSVFHAERWDYVFSFKRAGEPQQLRKMTVFFKGDLVERFEADALPTEAAFISSLYAGRKPDKLPALEASEELLKQFAPAPKRAAPKPMPEPPANYPPLEP